MTNLFPLLNSILLLVTHPLEPINLINYDFTKVQYSFTQGQYYTAPGNGFVKDVVEIDGLFQITLLLDDTTEVVYSGLSEVTKKKNERICAGESVGKDLTISETTKYVLMLYENSNLFPQFISNDLTFLVDKGTMIYAIADATVITQDFIPMTYGVLIQSALKEKTSSVISYMHLQRSLQPIDGFVPQGKAIAISGNTGNSESPRLKVRFNDSDLGTDIRVIYMRLPRK